MRLSELKDDTLLLVKSNKMDDDGSIIEKKDYITNIEEYREHKVFLAELESIHFDLEFAIKDQIDDIAGEDCSSSIMYYLDNVSDTNAKDIEKIIDDAIAHNPTYYEGEEVTIDI